MSGDVARVRMEDLSASAANRPSGYLECCLAAGTVVDGWLVLPWDVYQALVRQFGGQDGQRCGGCAG